MTENEKLQWILSYAYSKHKNRNYDKDYKLAQQFTNEHLKNSHEWAFHEKYILDEGYMRYDAAYPVISHKGISFVVSGGFTPNNLQKFKRFIKGDSGYGNLWKILNLIIGFIIGLLTAYFQHWLTCR